MTTVYGIDGMERHKTPNGSAIREIRASVCLSVLGGRAMAGKRYLYSPKMKKMMMMVMV